MPYQFIQPILREAPEGSRPLKRLDPIKRKRYLDLCAVIVKRFPSESSRRAIEFLLDLCRNVDPGPTSPIPFYTQPGQQDRIVVGQSVLARVIPTVRFEARINRRR